MPDDVRTDAYFSGTVQGVGFRYTTRRVAAGFAVTGFVRNLSDGRVQVVAEGTRTELEAFLNGISAAMAGCVSSRRASFSAATGEFTGFTIRL